MRPHRRATMVRSAPTLGRVGVIVGAYCVLIAATMALWPSLWAVLPVLGCSFLLSGFLNAAHDCIHATHVRPKWVNRVLGAAWCTFILVNYTVYRQQHLVHHRFPGVAGDTEVHAEFEGIKDYIRAQSGAAYWTAIFRRMASTLRGNFPQSIGSDRLMRMARIDNSVIIAWLVTAVGLTTIWPREWIAGYWIPLVFYPAFVLFFSLPEHLELNRAEAAWPRARDVRSNALVRFFQWNANYHCLHHRFPGVPAYALHGFNAARADSGEPSERSYAIFHLTLILRLLRGEMRHG